MCLFATSSILAIVSDVGINSLVVVFHKSYFIILTSTRIVLRNIFRSILDFIVANKEKPEWKKYDLVG